MNTIREITRLATMLAGMIAPRLRLSFAPATFRLRLDYASTSFPCEHCHSSHYNFRCAPRHVIYYCHEGLREYFYVISRAEYEKNSMKIPADNFDLEYRQFKVKDALRIFSPIFSASMTLQSHLQLSLAQRMIFDLDCGFSRSRILQWFFQYFFRIQSI